MYLELYDVYEIFSIFTFSLILNIESFMKSSDPFILLTELHNCNDLVIVNSVNIANIWGSFTFSSNTIL